MGTPKGFAVKADRIREQVGEQFPPAVIELDDGRTILFRVPLQFERIKGDAFWEKVEAAPGMHELALVLMDAVPGQDADAAWRDFTEDGYTERDFQYILKAAVSEYEDRLGKFRYSS